MDAPFLLADIGGTHSRIALARHTGIVRDTARRFRNDAYESFEDLLAEFVSGHADCRIEACVVAVAGPVLGQTARLTNRNWTLSATGLQTITGCQNVRLLNDLTAAGYALDGLHEDGLLRLTPRTTAPRTNAQALVIGLGTGFNVCPVMRRAAGTVCFQAEAGHAGLPVAVERLLGHLDAHNTGVFETIEHCFSGAGLERLHHLTTGSGQFCASEIFAAALQDPNGPAARTLKLYSQMLGVLTRSLIVTFMPLGGVYFAGGVARALLGQGFCGPFADAMTQPYALNAELNTVPAYLITDDFTALSGCLAALDATI